MDELPPNSEVIPILSTKYGLIAPLYMCISPVDFDPKTSKNMLYLDAEEGYAYTSFFADFGPLDLGLTHKFCQQLEGIMNLANKDKKSVTVYCKNNINGHARSNTAVLICAYLVFVMKFTAELSYKPFLGIKRPLTPFRDAAFALNTWPLFVLDCCRSFRRAYLCGHHDYKTYDMEKYEFMSQLHNGDMCWIVPGKLMAFSGPLAKRKELASGKYTMIPEDYIQPFKKHNIKCVVRFNNKCYDKRIFEKNGIRHVDLFYEDGGNPTEQILQGFLRLCETQDGGIAVHCKAGLGRTGTNIVAFMCKHLGYSIREGIAWHRVCRPGAVVGPQQQYLCSIEDKLKMEGAHYKAANVPVNKTSQVTPNGGSGSGSRVLTPTKRTDAVRKGSFGSDTTGAAKLAQLHM